ncbi:MAG: hypothetical protein GY788_10290 [bacterium]|nr:hypothetical protein [bacterium]
MPSSLVTMHSAKGLEWPVVIPVNSSTRFRPADQFVYRRTDDTLHLTLGGIAPPEMMLARDVERRQVARERERLWYVACTRARDLLILPYLPGAHEQSWSKVIDVGQGCLEEFDSGSLPASVPRAAEALKNQQSPLVFADEAKHVKS